jgi:hypothetical protein
MFEVGNRDAVHQQRVIFEAQFTSPSPMSRVMEDGATALQRLCTQRGTSHTFNPKRSSVPSQRC